MSPIRKRENIPIMLKKISVIRKRKILEFEKGKFSYWRKEYISNLSL